MTSDERLLDIVRLLNISTEQQLAEMEKKYPFAGGVTPFDALPQHIQGKRMEILRRIVMNP